MIELTTHINQSTGVFWTVINGIISWYITSVLGVSSSHKNNSSGWWFQPSEKYEFVSWDDEIPNIWKVIKFHGSSHHQPVLVGPWLLRSWHRGRPLGTVQGQAQHRQLHGGRPRGANQQRGTILGPSHGAIATMWPPPSDVNVGLDSPQ